MSTKVQIKNVKLRRLSFCPITNESGTGDLLDRIVVRDEIWSHISRRKNLGVRLMRYTYLIYLVPKMDTGKGKEKSAKTRIFFRRIDSEKKNDLSAV